MLDTSTCDPVEQMCNTLYDYANHLLCNAKAALDACFDEPCNFSTYLSMGPGDDGVRDALIVVIGPFTPTANSGQVGPSVYQAQFDVRLRESGYPMVQAVGGGRSIAMPAPDKQHEATRQVMAHAGAILSRLTWMKSTGCMAPEGYRCGRASIGGMVPLPPQGGVTGFSISVVINLPWG